MEDEVHAGGSDIAQIFTELNRLSFVAPKAPNPRAQQKTRLALLCLRGWAAWL